MNGSSSLNGRHMLRGGVPPVPCRPGPTLVVHWNTCMITRPLQWRSRFIILSPRTGRRCNYAASQEDVRTTELGFPGWNEIGAHRLPVMRVIEAQCAWILVPNDHLHNNQMGIRVGRTPWPASAAGGRAGGSADSPP